MLIVPCVSYAAREHRRIIMGLSIRARAWLRERQRQRLAERLAAEQAAQAAAEAHHAEFYDRHRAAEYLGISTHKLKRLMAAGKGPCCVKAGDTKQATVRWPIDELRAFKADPAGYVAAMSATASP
jgi:hypothetical protein